MHFCGHMQSLQKVQYNGIALILVGVLAQPLIVTAQVSNGAVMTSVALFLDVDQSTIVPTSAQQSTGIVNNNNNNGGGITNNNNNGGSEAPDVPASLAVRMANVRKWPGLSASVVREWRGLFAPYKAACNGLYVGMQAPSRTTMETMDTTTITTTEVTP